MAVSITALLLGGGCASRMSVTPLAWRFTSGSRIPDGYSTYTLFLNASTGYPDRDAPAKLRALERQFKDFGDSIGNANLAVWVAEARETALSVSKGKYYADVLSAWSGNAINYSDGPFVIVTDRNPDNLGKREEGDKALVIVIAFGNVGAARIVEVLNAIETRIRRDDINMAKMGLSVFWIRLKSIWDGLDKEMLSKMALALLQKA